MPKVSVIIPVYNVEKYLTRCLQSVCGQTMKDIEIICVNDGSTDNSAHILAEFAAQDSRVKVITQENRVQSIARNIGIEKAIGNYIFFVDADDFIHQQTLEYLYMIANKSKCNVISMNNVKKYDSECIDMTNISYEIHKNALEHLLNNNASSSVIWNKLYKTKLIKNYKFIPGIYFEDWPWLTILFSEVKSYATTEKSLYYYNEKNISTMRSIFTVRKLDDYVTGIETVYKFYHQNKYLKYWKVVRKKRISNSIKMMINKTYHEKNEHKQLAIHLFNLLDKLHKEHIVLYREFSLKIIIRIIKMKIRGLYA